MKLRLGSLILFSSRIEQVLVFYRSLGVPLEAETHDEGSPLHYAAELDRVHVAVYESPRGESTRWREGGCTFPGFVVDDFGATLERLRDHGASILSGPEDRPWGLRVVVADPDGRPIELWSDHG